MATNSPSNGTMTANNEAEAAILPTTKTESSDENFMTVPGSDKAEALLVHDSTNINIQWKPTIHVTQGENTIPENIAVQMEAELNQNSEVFQETTGFSACLDILKMYGSAVITADPGDGKTTLACGVGRYLRDTGWGDGSVYSPLIIKSPQEWRQYVNPAKQQLVIIDDMLGSQNLSTDMLNHWLTLLPNIEACVERGEGMLLLIIVSRKSILLNARDHLAKFKLFDMKKIIDLSEECNLTRDDMKRITIMHKRKAKLDLSEEQVDNIVQSCMRQGFPRTCDVIIRSGADPSQVESRFKHPTDILLNELQILCRDPNLKALLMLCMFADGELRVADALHSLSQNQRKVMEYAGLPQSATFVQLMQAHKSVPECYLKLAHQRSQKVVKFSHPSVFFAVAQLLAKEHMEFLLQESSFKLIADVIRLESDNTRDVTTTLAVDEQYEELLARRFLSELQQGNLQAVCSHPAFTSKDFISFFLVQARQAGHNNILSSTDCVNHFPMLYWSVWNKAGSLCLDILSTEYRRKSIKQMSEDVFIAIVGACVANNSDALGSLLQLVTPEVLRKCFEKKQDLQRKATQSSDYYPSLLHIACRFGTSNTVLQVLTHQQEHLRAEHMLQILKNSISSDDSDMFLLLLKNMPRKTLHQVFNRWVFPKSFKNKIAQIVSFLAKCGGEILFKIARRYEVSVSNWQKNSKTQEIKFKSADDGYFLITIIPRSSIYGRRLQEYHPQTELYEAAIADQVEVVDTLLQMEVDPNTESQTHEQAVLHACCRLNKLEIVKCLLRHNADVNLPNQRTKQTPLYAACYAGNYDIASLLMNNGATWKNQRDGLHACFRVACKRGNVDMASMLVEGGASVNLVWSRDLETPLGIACLENHVDLARTLIDMGADVNGETGRDQETVLLRACKARESEELVPLLVRHGCEVNRRSGAESTSPLEQARQIGHEETVKYLLDVGAV